MKKTIVLCAALLALGLAAGKAPAKEPLKIGYSDWPGFTAWEIGKAEGIFKKNGVDVELVWFPVYTDSLTALNTGQLDGNLQTWSDTMAPLAEGIDLKVVQILDNSFGNDAIVAKPGIDSIKGLKGKTVGTELATVDHFMLLKALAMNGMSEKDITYTNLTVGDAAAAFIAGKIDAAAIWQPWIAQIQREGKGKVIFSSADIPGLIPDLHGVPGEGRRGAARGRAGRGQVVLRHRGVHPHQARPGRGDHGEGRRAAPRGVQGLPARHQVLRPRAEPERLREARPTTPRCTAAARRSPSS